MLRYAFKIAAFLDRTLASEDQRQDAVTCAHDAIRLHGRQAIDVILHELRSERSTISKRTLRLAVAHLVADRYIVVRLAPVDNLVLAVDARA